MATTVQSYTTIDIAGHDDDFMAAQYQWLNDQMQGTAHEPILLSDFDNMMAQPALDEAKQHDRSSEALPHPSGDPDSCLRRAIEIFPDISHAYVRELWEDRATNLAAHGQDRYLAVLEHITSQTTYPKEQEKQKEKADLVNNITLIVSDKVPWEYQHVGIYLLSQEFPELSISCIKSTLNSGAARIADAYHRLATKVAHDTLPQQKKGKLKKKKTLSPLPPKLLEKDILGPWLDYATNEFNNARDSRAEKELEAARIAAELLNEEEARAAGAITECGCCFTDTPLNRTITCSSDARHHFCFDCSTSLVKNEIGNRKCRPVCMDTSGCAAAFTESELRLCLPEKMLGHLLRLQQQEDVKAAGIDGLEECPFCDFMAICAPKEVDREFVCGNPDCSKTSCRFCSAPTHVPRTCEEAKADDKITARHTVEEAMTEALVRVCNNATCRNRFVKLDGCNKMTCNKCGTYQCYVCKQTITGYEHFGVGPGKCPQSMDDAELERLYAKQVKKAEETARAKVVAETGVNGEDLVIKVSERVKQDEENAKSGTNGGLPGGDPLQRYLAGMEAAQEGDLEIFNGGLILPEARPQPLPAAVFGQLYGPPHALGHQLPQMRPVQHVHYDFGNPQGQMMVPLHAQRGPQHQSQAHATWNLNMNGGNLFGQAHPLLQLVQPLPTAQLPPHPAMPVTPIGPYRAFGAFVPPLPFFAGPEQQPQAAQVQHNPFAAAQARSAENLRRKNQTLIRLRCEREQRAALMAAQRKRRPRTPHAGGTNEEQRATQAATVAPQPNPPTMLRQQPRFNVERPHHRRQADDFFEANFAEDRLSTALTDTLGVYNDESWATFGDIEHIQPRGNMLVPGHNRTENALTLPDGPQCRNQVAAPRLGNRNAPIELD